MKNKKFWAWKNQADTESERALELYGTIAEESWFDDDVTPQMFRDELFAGTGPVTVWLNSPGGDCVAASQIYSMLMDYRGDVTVKIDGIAASAASVIAMAGTKVLMAPTALMMIHNPITVAYGNTADMQKAIEMLDEVKESIGDFDMSNGILPSVCFPISYTAESVIRPTEEKCFVHRKSMPAIILHGDATVGFCTKQAVTRLRCMSRS